ncbi:MAG TPA: hypothetical protein VGM01_03310 [Ktedonobacteraceae bacterium]
MRPLLQAIRRYAIAISLVHLAVFASFFVPYLSDPQENLWQVLLPPWNELFAFSHAALIIIASIMFIPLIVPPVAAWVAVRSPLKLMGLVCIRVSLPLLFASWFFWSVLAVELYSPASGVQGALRLVLFAPVCGFALAFCLCLGLAGCLRRLKVQNTSFSMSQSTQDENQLPGEGEKTAFPATSLLLPRLFVLTAFGLLCQVLVILSLFLPFTETYDPYKGVAFHITGWQTLGLGFPLALIMLLLLFIPLFPLFATLLYRSSLSLKFVQKNTLLAESINVSYWLNMLCFILSSIILEYSLLFIGADFNKETRWLDAAFGIPSLAFLGALLCSGILRVYALRYTTESATVEMPGL